MAKLCIKKVQSIFMENVTCGPLYWKALAKLDCSRTLEIGILKGCIVERCLECEVLFPTSSAISLRISHSRQFACLVYPIQRPVPKMLLFWHVSLIRLTWTDLRQLPTRNFVVNRVADTFKINTKQRKMFWGLNICLVLSP